MNARSLIDALTDGMSEAVVYSCLVGATPTVWLLPWTERDGWLRIGETLTPTAYLRARRHAIDAAAVGIIASATASNGDVLVLVAACDFATRTPTAAHLHHDGTIHDHHGTPGPALDVMIDAFTYRFN